MKEILPEWHTYVAIHDLVGFETNANNGASVLIIWNSQASGNEHTNIESKW